jgi:hypothetical protein
MRLLNTVIIFVASLNYMIREVKKKLFGVGISKRFSGADFRGFGLDTDFLAKHYYLLQI